MVDLFVFLRFCICHPCTLWNLFLPVNPVTASVFSMIESNQSLRKAFMLKVSEVVTE